VDIAAWLRGLGLGQYEQTFRDNAVDAEILPKLTGDDLREMGVVAIGHRRKLLEAVAALRDGTPAARADAGEAEVSPGQAPGPPTPQAERRQL
jgi:hypothetical protein